jgi:hypothetical protein
MSDCFDKTPELKGESMKDESIDGYYPGNESVCKNETFMPAKNPLISL